MFRINTLKSKKKKNLVLFDTTKFLTGSKIITVFPRVSFPAIGLQTKPRQAQVEHSITN